MEALSPTMEEGRLVEWKKQEGDTVAVGDVLAEVETDKAVMELVARAAGTLLKHIVEAGSTVPVSEPVAVIGQPGEDGGTGGERESGAAEPTPSGAAGQRGSRISGHPAFSRSESACLHAAGPPPPQLRQRNSDVRKAVPHARQRRQEHSRHRRPQGQSLTTCPPDRCRARGGPGGCYRNRTGGTRCCPRPRQRQAAALQRLPRCPASPAAPAPLPRRQPFQATSPTPTLLSLRSGRRSRGDWLNPSVRSRRSISRVKSTWSGCGRHGKRCARRGSGAAGQRTESKVSFNDIIIKAVALALRQHPACNAWWQNDHIRYWNEVHMSMAVAIDEGLITPVIRHADQKSLREIGAEARDLARRARERRLKPEEYTGGTFSISNLGMLDIEEFTAIINPPEAGILAVGRIVQKAVEHEGALALRRRMRLTMSCDHRVIDGATGAQFLKTLKGMLENPLALVW